MRALTILFLLLSVLTVSCTETDLSGPSSNDFDRQAMLENWADNIIIPSYEAFSGHMATLHADAEAFTTTPNQTTLDQLRNSWETAYLSWQNVSQFEIGTAAQIRYRDNMNIYPVNTTELEKNIADGSYNLSLPAENDRQGFPALDYLLFGLSTNDGDILDYYTTHQNADGYKTYLLAVTERMKGLTDTVLDSWKAGYRDEFVQNSGNGANSSVDMMVNDYVFYYEKVLRAGKIGIPAGVFSGSPLPTHVEAYYNQELSKALALEAIDAAQAFFNGEYFDGNGSGESLKSYLDFLNTMKEGADLSNRINTQFESARSQANSLSSNFRVQINTDNSAMLSTYDQLQRNVVFLKVDMLQALNINVDYIDADGD